MLDFFSLSMYKEKNNYAHFCMNRFAAHQCAELFFSLYIDKVKKT